MKLKALLACLALVCGQAFATTYTWTDTVNPTPDRLITPLSPYTFTFDISDGATGFRPYTDTVANYSVYVNLYDDQDFFLTPFEVAWVDMPGILGTTAFGNLNGSEYGNESILGFFQLNQTGQLTVTIWSSLGDFYFGDAKLTANGVPEPSSMLLFGAALTAITLVTRRRRQQ